MPVSVQDQAYIASQNQSSLPEKLQLQNEAVPPPAQTSSQVQVQAPSQVQPQAFYQAQGYNQEENPRFPKGYERRQLTFYGPGDRGIAIDPAQGLTIPLATSKEAPRRMPRGGRITEDRDRNSKKFTAARFNKLSQC